MRWAKLRYWGEVHAHGLSWWQTLKLWWSLRHLEIVYHEDPQYLVEDGKS